MLAGVEDPIARLVAKRNFILRLVEQVGRLHAEGLPASRIARVLLGPEPLLHYLSGGEFSRLFLVRLAERLVWGFYADHSLSSLNRAENPAW